MEHRIHLLIAAYNVMFMAIKRADWLETEHADPNFILYSIKKEVIEAGYGYMLVS